MTHIGIMTFLHNDNYGSTLQAWALERALEQLGHSAEHIDYAPSGREKLRNLVQSGNSLSLLLDGVKKRAIKAEQTGAREKSEAFRDFNRRELKLSRPCHDQAALAATAKDYDVLMAGSDQVWSPVWLNPAYFLDFAGDRPRVSYAASLGVQKAPSARKTRIIKRLVAPFRAVSVREAEGAALLEQMTGRRADVMPDPVVLMPREAWLKLAEKPIVQEPYLLCYYIGRNSSYWTRTAELAKGLGLKVVVIPVTEDDFRQPYRIEAGLSPEKWLGWIAGASMVMTDSFHGTVFSTILGVPVQVLRRYSEDDPESKNSRIDHLLREIGAQGQEVIQPNEQIEDSLNCMRKRGMEWLDQAISQAAAH